ncbi:MAG: PhoH family protein [Thermodesulfovibrionia bacterium]|nr:PhoH family protein [Thermodesulfovibrionia bacterium]
MRRTFTVKLELDLNEGKDLSQVYERFDKSLRIIEEAFGIEASIRGNKVLLQGKEKSVKRAQKLIKELQTINSNGYILNPEDIKYIIKSIDDAAFEDPSLSLKEFFFTHVPVSSKKKFIVPRSETQKKYIETIKKYDMVIGIGPAGTGKTYLAMAMAINALLKKQVSRIILARPAVEAGERLGFLPGDLYEKVNPYLKPLYDALFDMMETEKAHKLIERGVIEIAPLAFMRGRTLNDSFVILDEAQNTTSEQMKMYLTRLGFDSKTVITGDITQIDLPTGKTSGLIEAEKILKNIKELCFIYFTEKDVVRHRLVQQIVKAYERFEGDRKEK